MGRGESPGYPLGDAPEDGGVEERAWVPTDWAATPEAAVAWFREQWPEALEGLADDDLELVPAVDAEGEPIVTHMQLSPCAGCDGTGAEQDPFWRAEPPGAYGPPPACESCEGTGEQRDDGDAILWRACKAHDDGAVEFWVLVAEERDPARP